MYVLFWKGQNFCRLLLSPCETHTNTHAFKNKSIPTGEGSSAD